MTPYPRYDGGFPPVIPYAVPMVNDGDEHIGVSLPPGGKDELWRIGYTGTGTDGIMSAAQFAAFDQRWRGLVWRFDPDERWELLYRIVCDNRPDVEFRVVLTADQGFIRCDLKDV